MKLLYLLVPLLVVGIVSAYTLPGHTVKGNIDVYGNKIINSTDPVNDTDLATKYYVDNAAVDLTALPGHTVSGNIDMLGNGIINSSTPVDDTDVVIKSYVDSSVSSVYEFVNDSTPYVTVGPYSYNDYQPGEIQDALNLFGDVGASGVVVLEPYNYTDSDLVVPPGVSLVGSVSPLYGGGVLGGVDELGDFSTCRLMVTDVTDSPVTLSIGSVLRNIDFYWPDQSSNTSSPTVYPFAITIASYGGYFPNHVLISDCHFVNAYNGIDASTSHSELTISSVRGTVLKCGVKLLNGGHGDFLENIEFLPHYGGLAVGSATLNYIQHNLVAFDIGQCDNSGMSNCGVWTAAYGLYMHGAAGFTVTDCIFDTVMHPLVLNGTSWNNIIQSCYLASYCVKYDPDLTNDIDYDYTNYAVLVENAADTKNTIVDNKIRSTGHGIYNNGELNVYHGNNVFFGMVNYLHSAFAFGVLMNIDSAGSVFTGNVVDGNSYVGTIGIVAYDSNLISSNEVVNCFSGAYVDNAGNVSGKRVVNNVGINPAGAISAPAAVPASANTYTNYQGYPILVTVSGGTVSQIAINGVNTGLTSGAFTLGPDNTICITHSSSPVWKWTGL